MHKVAVITQYIHFIVGRIKEENFVRMLALLHFLLKFAYTYKQVPYAN